MGPQTGTPYVPVMYPLKPKGPVLQIPVKNVRDHIKGPWSFTARRGAERRSQGVLLAADALFRPGMKTRTPKVVTPKELSLRHPINVVLPFSKGILRRLRLLPQKEEP